MVIKNILLLLTFAASVANATLDSIEKATVRGQNLLVNGGVENGKQGWSRTDANADSLYFTAATGAAEFMGIGKMNMAWQAGSSADYLNMPQVTIAAGYAGRNMVYSCVFQRASAIAPNYTFEVYDGSSVIASNTDLIAASYITTATRFSVPFIAGASGTTFRGRLSTTTSPAGTVWIDDCWAGPIEDFNLSNISQAQFVGSAYINTQASCAGWTRTNTALGAFATDTDCTAPVVEFNPGPGTISTTDADLPKFTVSSLPRGKYKVVMAVSSVFLGTTSTGCLAINDGTTTSGGTCVTSANTTAVPMYIEGAFDYTSAASHTFELYGSATTGSINPQLSVGQQQLRFYIYRYPTATDVAYSAATVPFLWTGTHGSDCQWSSAATTIASPAGDATCTFTSVYSAGIGTVSSSTASSNNTPGLVFTAPTVGVYEVCANTMGTASGGGLVFSARLTNGTADTTAYDETAVTANATTHFYAMRLCGQYSVTAASTTVTPFIRYLVSASTGLLGGNATVATPAIRWTIRNLSQTYSTPLLVNTVVNATAGVTNTCSGYITNAGTPAVSSSDGTCLSLTSDNGTGDTTLAIAAGTFSAAPRCTCSSYSTLGGCQISSSTAISATAVRVFTYTPNTNAGRDTDFFLLCWGPK